MLLVTGITGHTGQYFLQELIQNNFSENIRCVVRQNSNTKTLESSGLNIELVYGDLNDNSFIQTIMTDVDTVLHIYNIHHSPQVIRAAIYNNVKWVILVHTTGIYSKYKSASEEYKRIESDVLRVANGKLKLTILRPTMIYGDLCDRNMSKFIKSIDKLKFYPLINRGRSKIQPVNARDLGKAYYNVLTNPEITANKQYDLSGDRPITIREVLEKISDYLNKKTIFIPIPLSVSVLIAYMLKGITFGKLDVVEKVLRMGEDRIYRHEAATKDFNFTPMSFEKGIELEINEYIKKYKEK